jgi:hypothetical protein
MPPFVDAGPMRIDTHAFFRFAGFRPSEHFGQVE